MSGFDLFREMEHIGREMDGLFRGLDFGRLLEPSFATQARKGSYPRVNLRQDADNVYVKALLPGVDPKALEMTVLKGVLTISGERNGSTPEGVSWHRRERGNGKFMRAIDVPVDVDIDKVKADFQDGLLTVTLPKAATERPKRIAVGG